MTTELLESCRAFNQMYRLPVSDTPTFANLREPVEKRLTDFKKTLDDEVKELEDIDSTKSEEEVLVEIADLLADVCVYCHSEAVKYGIPLDQVLEIIMDSNKSKLNADGSASYNAEGKVMKGAFYWKPEPKILTLFRKMKENKVVEDEAAKYLTQESSS